MLSTKSYLIKAFYDWIVDSNCTPIIAVDANAINHEIVQQCVLDNDEITFNISAYAVRNLAISYENITFNAQFSGLIKSLSIPIPAVLAIYADENQEGMYFDCEEQIENAENDHPSASAIPQNQSRPNLYLVE